MKRQVLIRPFVTEKMTNQMEEGHYAFVVDRGANKVEVRKAIESRYPHVRLTPICRFIARAGI